MWREDKKGSPVSEQTCKSDDREEYGKHKKRSILRNFVKILICKCKSDASFEKLSGFSLKDFVSLERFTALVYRPTDPASLGVVRSFFGLCMVLDVIDERGLADIDIKWGDPFECHFPLVHGMRPPSLPWVIVIYTAMWLGAFGIMIGLHFKLACACFVVPYWYIFLLDKSYWNNHTYLYGIVATLLWGTEANKYFALDADKARRAKSTVPLWNYLILKFQFFALYFLAGLKKSGKEWLEGYAMMNLSRHWVFSPFRLFLTTGQTDFFIVHWFAFVFDLTVGFWLLLEKTRIPAMIFCTAFHLMNSRLFNIGMFPYVCLATMPLFCNVDWPRKLGSCFSYNYTASFYSKMRGTNNYNKKSELKQIQKTDSRETSKTLTETMENENRELDDLGTTDSIFEKEDQKSSLISSKENLFEERELPKSVDNNIARESKINRKIKEGSRTVTKRQKFVVSLLLLHVALQLFLPYSHFITKGYNNWVPGLYGYSWDMMVYTWDTVLVVIKVHDNVSDEVRYVDPKAWVQNDRWERHADMARQYAFCLKDNLLKRTDSTASNYLRHAQTQKLPAPSTNLSIYIDVWCSLNGRFQQRMFNPNVDLLTVDWSPFKSVSFLMPLLTQYNSYRYKLEKIQREVYTWSNDTDVLFVADFPGMHLDNYISTNFTNVSLTVLEGEVKYSDKEQANGVIIPKDSTIPIKTGSFHKIKTTSAHPACYMYTYNNPSKHQSEIERIIKTDTPDSIISILKEAEQKVSGIARAFGHIADAFFYLVYDVPMMRRVRIHRN